jgi:EAL domain-containing protein (putative c-di-GMP-specific phosphodiesterase class I)
VVEITESAVVADAERAVSILSALRTVGVNLAVDDFGTGYSSLAYLKKFPFSILKIDRSFVSGLGQSECDDAIVTAILRLAGALELRTIAEGVETIEQLEHLWRLGARQAQGFYFARPMTVVDADALLASSSAPPMRAATVSRIGDDGAR